MSTAREPASLNHRLERPRLHVQLGLTGNQLGSPTKWGSRRISQNPNESPKLESGDQATRASLRIDICLRERNFSMQDRPEIPIRETELSFIHSNLLPKKPALKAVTDASSSNPPRNSSHPPSVFEVAGGEVGVEEFALRGELE